MRFHWFSAAAPGMFRLKSLDGFPVAPAGRREPVPTQRSVRALILTLTFAILLLDLVFPLGVAAGVPCVAVVLLSFWLPDRRNIFRTAGLSTALTIGGFFVPYPAGPDFWIGLENRLLALFAIWATAILGNRVMRGQEMIRQERDFNESLIESASSIILLIDCEQQIVLFNSYAAELIGRPLEEVRGEDWLRACVPPRERSRIRVLLRESLDERAARSGRFPLVAANGTERQFSWSFKPIVASDGRVAGLLSVGQDITALVHAQERAVKAERLAAIGQTLAALSHARRQPPRPKRAKLGVSGTSRPISRCARWTSAASCSG